MTHSKRKNLIAIGASAGGALNLHATLGGIVPEVRRYFRIRRM